MALPLTAALTGAVLIVLQQILMLNTGMHRVKTQIGVGVGDDLHLERKARRHGNLAENAALFVIVLGLTELITGSSGAVSTFAAVFVGARLCHALGFSSLSGSHGGDEGSKVFVLLRALGAFGTALSGVGLGAYLMYQIVVLS